MTSAPEVWAARRALALREAQRVLRSPSDAEDCAQEVLLGVLRRPEQLAQAQRQEAWLTTVARRRAIDHLRRTRREPGAAVTLLEPDDRSAADVADEVASRLTAQVLARDVAQLPPMTQRVLDQLALGRTTAEAAQELGITKRAADAHLHRARRALRERWTLAMAALAGAFALARRPVTPLVAVAAVPAALLLGISQTPAPDSPGQVWPPAGLVAPASGTKAAATSSPHLPAAGEPRSQVSPPRLDQAGPQSTSTSSRPSTREVARVEPAPRTAVEVQHVDDGEQTGPVEAIHRCVTELVVTAEHVGC